MGVPNHAGNKNSRKPLPPCHLSIGNDCVQRRIPCLTCSPELSAILPMPEYYDRELFLKFMNQAEQSVPNKSRSSIGAGGFNGFGGFTSTPIASSSPPKPRPARFEEGPLDN